MNDPDVVVNPDLLVVAVGVIIHVTHRPAGARPDGRRLVLLETMPANHQAKRPGPSNMVRLKC
jgi:hypothetical protein